MNKSQIQAESSDGPMKLLNVLRVVLKRQNLHSNCPDVFVIYFKGGILLPVTGYHAFSGVRAGNGVVLKGSEIQPKDKIWVDVHAFLADGSLTVKNFGKSDCVEKC